MKNPIQTIHLPVKKGFSLKRVSATLAAATLSFMVSGVQATEWDMPTPYGDSNFHTANIRQFADDVRDATNGELDITVHSSGSLIKHPEIKNSVRRELVPIGELIMSRLQQVQRAAGRFVGRYPHPGRSAKHSHRLRHRPC